MEQRIAAPPPCSGGLQIWPGCKYSPDPVKPAPVVSDFMIVNRQRRVPVAIRPLQQFCECVRLELGLAPDAVTVQLISDEAMARLNTKFRHKRGPTDVLSFPANGAQPASEDDYIGDVAISMETARRNARRLSRSLLEEMRVLILHGMLHLAGYDHETDHGEMARLERRLRKRLGVAGP